MPDVGGWRCQTLPELPEQVIEPLDRFLEVLELDGETYRIIQRASGDTPARLKPFDAIEFDVAALWAR